MPMAASRLIAPVEIASIVIGAPSWPMRMIAPFPYERSICESAVSRAFCFWSLCFWSLICFWSLCAVAIPPP